MKLEIGLEADLFVWKDAKIPEINKRSEKDGHQ